MAVKMFKERTFGMFETGIHHSLTFHQEAIFKPTRLALSEEQFGIWYLETAIKLHHLYHSVSRGTSIFILVISCRNILQTQHMHDSVIAPKSSNCGQGYTWQTEALVSISLVKKKGATAA